LRSSPTRIMGGKIARFERVLVDPLQYSKRAVTS
jgi:hypothetical protein